MKIFNSSIACRYFFFSNLCLPSSNCSRQGKGLWEDPPLEQLAKRLIRPRVNQRLTIFQGNLFISILQYAVVFDESLVKLFGQPGALFELQAERNFSLVIGDNRLLDIPEFQNELEQVQTSHSDVELGIKQSLLLIPADVSPPGHVVSHKGPNLHQSLRPEV